MFVFDLHVRMYACICVFQYTCAYIICTYVCVYIRTCICYVHDRGTFSVFACTVHVHVCLFYCFFSKSIICNT